MEILGTQLMKNALDSSATVSLLKKTVPPMDKFLMRYSRGWINTGMQSLAMVTTTGAKSGQAREMVTLCMPVGLDIALVGSNWGQDNDPAWVHNMRGNPEVKVVFRGFKGGMLARELQGRERGEMWARLIRYNPQYAHYQDGTRRRLPVMLLTRLEL